MTQPDDSRTAAPVSVGVSPSGAPTPPTDASAVAALRADPAVAKAIDDYALQYAVPRRSFDALLAAAATAATAQTDARGVAQREASRRVDEAARRIAEKVALRFPDDPYVREYREAKDALWRAFTAGAPGGRAPTTTPTTTHTEAGDDA